MPRYSETPIIKNSIGQRQRATWIYIAPPAANTDIYIRTTSPERLDRLANKFYKNQFNWPVIAAANGIGKGTLWVKSNTVLRIPYSQQIDISNYITSINKSR